MVKELLTRAGESGSTPGNAVFVSFFFFCLVFVF